MWGKNKSEKVKIKKEAESKDKKKADRRKEGWKSRDRKERWDMKAEQKQEVDYNNMSKREEGRRRK